MALGGFITANGYARIENLIFSKHRKNIILDLVVYEDSTCQRQMATTPIRIGALDDVISVPDYIATEPVAGEMADGTERFYKTATPGHDGWNNHIITYDEFTRDDGPEKVIHSRTPKPGMLVEVASDGKVWRYDGDTELWGEIDYAHEFTPTAWENNFGPTAQNALDKNLVGIIYDYIKTKPEFSACTDV